MAGKVIHLDDETHKKMKDFCQQNDIPASRWVESLIYDAVRHYSAIVDRPKGEVPVKVEKKRIPESPPPKEDDPWVQPPFWEKNE